MKKVIKILSEAGSFAENKDVARKLRVEVLEPALATNNAEIIIDFNGVSGATQSFIHALISQPIRDYGDDVFSRLLFKDCNQAIEQVINIVADYMAES